MTAFGSSQRRIALWSFQGIVIVAFCWVAFHNIDVQRLKSVLGNVNVPFIVAAIALLIAERLVRPYRLAVLLGAPSSFTIVAAQSVSQLANLILPMRTGEMLLVLLLRELTPVAGSYAMSIVIIDRLLDVIFILLVFAGALAVVPALPAITGRAALVLAIFCVVVITLLLVVVTARVHVTTRLEHLVRRLAGERAERWLLRIEQIIDGFAVLLDIRRLAVALLATAATWGLATCAAWLVLRGIWPDAPPGAAALAICFGVIGVTLVSVPAGIGVVHAAFALGVMVFGATQEIGLAFAILAHFFATMTTAAMGLFSLPVVKHTGAQIWTSVWHRQTS